MRYRIGNSIIEIDFVKKATDIISDFQLIHQEYEETIRKINSAYKQKAIEVSIFSDDELLKKSCEDALAAANQEYKTHCIKFNKRINQYLEEVKNGLLSELSESNNSTEYILRFNNALIFFNAEGTNITDDIASEIFGEFKKDMPLMHRVRRMVELKLETPLLDASGNTTFPKTFGNLQKYEMYLTQFNTVCSIAENLFLLECVNGEVEYIKGYKLTVPMLSYPEMLYEAQIIEEADLLQEMTSELFESA